MDGGKSMSTCEWFPYPRNLMKGLAQGFKALIPKSPPKVYTLLFTGGKTEKYRH